MKRENTAGNDPISWTSKYGSVSHGDAPGRRGSREAECLADAVAHDLRPHEKKRYYFEFSRMPNVVWVDLRNLDLNVDTSEQVFDLAKDLEAAGEVSGKFQPCDPFIFQKAGTAITWKPE